MGAEVVIEGLTKSFGKQAIWRDVTLTLPPGEVSAMLGPSGTGKSVFLKSMIGLLKPDRGRCVINGVDIVTCSEHKLYEIRKLFGVLFQDGALFGSMNLYDNVAFPLREHTKKSETEIRRIVLEKLEMTGLNGADKKLPGEISGGMRKRAGLARALVLDPRDHPGRRAGLGPRPGPHDLHLAAVPRPQRADRRDVPDRHAQHQPGPHRAGQPGHALPQGTGHVRPARGAADQRGAGRQAVPQRQDAGPDRHVRGEGHRPDGGRAGDVRRRAPRGRGRGRQRRAAADAADAGRADADGRGPPQGPRHGDHAPAAARPRRRASSRRCRREEQRHYGVQPAAGRAGPAAATAAGPGRRVRPGDGVPNQHHGQLPADQVARIPGGQPPRPGTHRMPPNNGPGGR